MPQLIIGLIILALIVEAIKFMAIPLLIIIIGAIIWYIGVYVYVSSYFSGEDFYNLKISIKDNTTKCNELNQHIEDLKKTYLNIKTTDYGQANYYDDSHYNFKRPNIKSMTNLNNVYNCSLEMCRKAKIQPYKYLCKYFNINADEKTLENLENVFNNFAAVEQGKKLLKNEREKIIDEIEDKVPPFIFNYYKDRLIKELGFEEITFNNMYCPKYSFVYVSAGGNSSMRCDIVLDTYHLETLIKYLAEKIEFQNSIAGQRALMTSALREKIKTRDNYTCKKCGLSINDEPNLLLEIDHIIPLSKGGITSENNLQTLCWRCNRTKGNKIE